MTFATPEQLYRFIYSGDAEMDPTWFWEQFGVTPQAIGALANLIGETLGVDPTAVLVILEQGARIGTLALD